MDKKTLVEAAVKRLLTALDVDPRDPNFRDTPQRVAAWLMEKFPDAASIDEGIGVLASRVFPSSYDEMIVQTGIRGYGLCPHHLKDVIYDIAIGYLPNGCTIGLSKLARAAVLVMGRAGTQEDLTDDLAERLERMLGVEDVAVVVYAKHHCMICRGVQMQNSTTVTSSMHGKFTHDDNGTKSEFLALVRNGRH